MAAADVDNSKERLIRLPHAPAIGFLAAFVIPAFLVFTPADVVISFGRVGSVVARLPQQIGVVGDFDRVGSGFGCAWVECRWKSHTYL